MALPAEQDIRKALAEIHDPELGRDIASLGVLKDVSVDGKRVNVTVSLVNPETRTRSYYEDVIPAKLKNAFPDIGKVNVRFFAMSDEERQELAARIHRDAPGPYQRPDAPTQVIAVGSGKGGVGKSTTTVNLAASLAKQGHTVGLLDADVWGFSIPRMLGLHEQPRVVGDLLIPPEMFGVKVISIGLFTTEDNPVVWRGPMLHKALQQFLEDVHWDDPEYLVVDLPPGTGDVSISIAQFLPGASMIVVTTPQQVAEKVAQRAGFMAEKTGLVVKGVIENMSYFRGDDGKVYRIFGEGGGRALAEQLRAPLLGEIPIDPELRKLADIGAPIVLQKPDTEVARALDETASRIAELLPPKPKPAKRIGLPLFQAPSRT